MESLTLTLTKAQNGFLIEWCCGTNNYRLVYKTIEEVLKTVKDLIEEIPVV